MRVLFFTPPARTSYPRLGRCGGRAKGGEKWPPVKIMFAAGAIRDLAEVRILDAEGVMSPEAFRREAGAFRPDLLVIEPTPGSLPAEAAWVRSLRDSRPELRCAAFGPFATPLAGQILRRYSEIDYVIEGEAELPLRAFVADGGSSPAPGMWFLRNGSPESAGPSAKVQNLDELGFPAHELIDPGIYRSPLVRSQPFTTTETSRGCPYGCTFCNARLLSGDKPRFRSIGHVLEELAFIRSLGFREVKFNDETFTLDRERVLALTEGIRRMGIDIGWKCNTRVDHLDDMLIDALSAAGCHTIFLGVESAVPEILEFYGKKVPLERVAEVVTRTREKGIRTVLHFVFGAPGESWDTVRRTIEFACSAAPDFVGFNILTPYPGTRISDDLTAEGLLTAKLWEEMDQSESAGIRTRHLSSKELEYAISLANRSFYFRPSYILRHLKDIRTPQAFGASIRGLFALLRKL